DSSVDSLCHGGFSCVVVWKVGLRRIVHVFRNFQREFYFSTESGSVSRFISLVFIGSSGNIRVSIEICTQFS
ncbi:MAG: hypothetical protein QF590_06175, partial [Dehalococcoidia bacterium]|nr:hypothetical protein [Dehalococcoidia bacterium]